ncbi:MAG: sulfite exporter TauE/SafE family protein [Methylococcaceae bacterium]
MLEIVLFSLLLGAFAGFLAGLLGVGGGLVIVPALVGLFSLHGFPPKAIMLMALATSLATIMFTSLASMRAHHRLGAVSWPIVYRLVPGILIGTALGALLADHLETTTLRWLCALYMLTVGVQMALKWQPIMSGIRHTRVLDSIAGLVIGGMSALVGIGGGTLSVPYLVSCQHPMKNAVAISSACGFPIAVAGTLSYALLGWKVPLLPAWSLGYVYLPAFLGIITLSIITAPLGAKLAHKLPAQKLKQIFSLLLFGAAFKLLWH